MDDDDAENGNEAAFENDLVQQNETEQKADPELQSPEVESGPDQESDITIENGTLKAEADPAQE